jgi:hypothetical protein
MHDIFHNVTVTIRIATVVSAGALAIACDEPDELVISIPHDVASEGTVSGKVADPCGPAKIASGCDPDVLLRIDSLRTADPTIAEITASSEKGQFGLNGLQPGATTVHATATFDDGTTREASAAIEVIAIDEVRVTCGCSREGVTAPCLAQADHEVSLRADSYGRGRRLEGAPRDVIEAEHLEYRTFTAPNEDGEFPITSRFDADVGIVLEAFTPARISGITASVATRPTRSGDAFQVDLFVSVEDRIPCHAGGIAVETLTPVTCVGGQGEATWEREMADHLFLTAVSEGQCQLRVTPMGSSLTHDVTFDVGFSR